MQPLSLAYGMEAPLGRFSSLLLQLGQCLATSSLCASPVPAVRIDLAEAYEDGFALGVSELTAPGPLASDGRSAFRRHHMVVDLAALGGHTPESRSKEHF